MKEYYQKLLKRPLEAILHFSDVFSGPETDFDAELTVTFRNLGTLSDKMYFVGGNARRTGYGAVLVNDLVLERKKIVRELGVPLAQKDQAIALILNSLPREGYEASEAPNGRDFHLAITEEGVMIFAVPLSTLSALEDRNAIVALYRIPNARIPLADGEHEQFRSSIIALSRFVPESMEPVFEYDSVEDLMRAKLYGTHPSIIPSQKYDIELAYTDRFGNVRLSVRDGEEQLARLGMLQFGDELRVLVGEEEVARALYMDALADVPVGKFGLYENVADSMRSYRKAKYWEFVKRSDHCLQDEKMGFDALSLAHGSQEVWNQPIRIEKVG